MQINVLFYYNTKETIISRSSVQRVTDLELQTLEIKKNSKLDLDININLKSAMVPENEQVSSSVQIEH